MSVSNGVTQWEKLADKFGEKAITENASGVFLLNVLVAKGRTIEKLRETLQKHGQHSEGISDEFLRAHYAHAAIYLYESTGYYSPDGKSVSYKELVYRAYLELCEAPVALAGSRNAVEIFQFAFGNTLRRLFADSARVETVGETVVGLKPRPTYKNIANAVKDLLRALYPNGVHPKIAHELRAVGDFLLGQNSLLVTQEGREDARRLGLMIDKAIGPQSAESEDSPAPAADAQTAVEEGEGKVEEEEKEGETEEEKRVIVGPAGGKEEEEGGEALFSSSKDSPFPPSAFPKRFTAESAGGRGGLVEVADTSAFGANVSALQGEERSKAVMEDTLVVKDKDATVSSIALAAVNAFMALNETDRRNAAGAMYNYLKVAEGGRPKFFPDRNPGTIEDRVEVLAAIISGLATANLDLNEIVKNFAGALFDRDPTLYSQETAKKALREFAAVNWPLLEKKKRDDYNKNDVGKGSVRPMYDQLGKLNEPKRAKKWLVYDLWVKASPLLQSVNIFWVKGRDGKDLLVFNEWSINAVVTTYRDKAIDGMLEYVKSALNGSVRAQVSKWIGTVKVLYSICQHFKFPVGKTIADFADLHRQCKNLVFDLDDTKASDVMDLVVKFFDIADKRPLDKLFSVSDTVPYRTVVQRTASAPAAPFPEVQPIPEDFDFPAVQAPPAASAAPPPTQKNRPGHSVVINPEDVDEDTETAGEGEEEERGPKRQKLATNTTITTTTKTVEKEKGPQKLPIVVANLPRPGTPPKKPEEPKPTQRPQTVFPKPPSTNRQEKDEELRLLLAARSKAAASSGAVSSAAIRSTLPSVAPSGRPKTAVDTKSVLQRPAAVEEPVETSPFSNPVLTKLLRLRVGNETQAPDSLHDTSDAATGLERRGELYARFDITRELVLEVLADLAAAVRKDTLFAATPAGSKLLAMCGHDMGILARSRHAVHTAFVRDERPFDLRRDDERLHIDPMIAVKRQFSAVSNLIADTIENPPPTLLPGFTVESELYVFKTVNYEARRQQEELQREQVSGSGFLSELSGGSGSGSGFLEDLPGGSGFLPNLQARSGIPFPVLGPSGNSLPSQGSNGPSRLGFVPVGGLSDEGLSERQAPTPPQ